MKKNLYIGLVIALLIFAIAAAYILYIKNSHPTWATYINTLYHYSIQYPQEPAASLWPQCGGLGISQEDEPPAERCYQIGIAVVDGPMLQEYIHIVVIDKPTAVPFEKFIEDVTKRADQKEIVETRQFGNKKAYAGTFKGWLGYSGNEDGQLFDQKTHITFIALNSQKVLRLTYPLEFCVQVVSTADGLMQSPVPCYSDQRNKLYEEITKTLKVK